VTAREEERSRIRREVHDGIGPLLAAALLRTETAMDLPSGSPSQIESLRKLHHLQQTALTDLRSLVKGCGHQPLTMEACSRPSSNTPN
jgi:signal transduction histidine kinase